MTVALIEDPAALGPTGLRRAAIALVALGPERASVLLRAMTDEEVALVAKQIAELGAVSPDEVRAVLEELGRGLREAQTLPAPGKRYAKELLVQALGAERGALMGEVLDRGEPFSWLVQVERETAAGVLASEPPTAVALALAHLEPKLAAQLLVRLPEDRRLTVAGRLAQLGAVHPDTLAEVEAGLRARMDDVKSVPVLPLAGPTLLASVLSRIGKEESGAMLDELAATSPELADEVRAALFTFDDLCAIEPRQMQLLLREVDMRVLATAIATSGPSIQRVFTGALSERARETLLEEVDLAANSRKHEVEDARRELVATARRLEEAGTLVLAREQDDDA